MIFPNVPCRIFQLLGDKDEYGESQYARPTPAHCSVVKLSNSSKSTSVRADSSASRGSAKEVLADARLLFSVNTQIKIGDRLEIYGFKLEVSSVRAHFQVFQNKIDHWQVDLNAWA